MFCKNCGKEIADEAVVCVGCGASVGKDAVTNPPQAAAVPKKAKTASLLGILSILLLAPLGIPAIILANQSKKETNGVMCKQAKTGLVCGIIGLCWWGLNLILLLANL